MPQLAEVDAELEQTMLVQRQEGAAVVAGRRLRRRHPLDRVIVSDQHGELTYVRIYSGKLEKGSRVLNSNRNKKENISRLFQMHANDRIANSDDDPYDDRVIAAWRRLGADMGRALAGLGA